VNTWPVSRHSGPRGELLRCLGASALAQSVGGASHQRDRAGGGRRLALGHDELAGPEVDVLPPEPEGLAATQPEAQRDDR
jgi:hypothetical protein